jgi:hypothetical protein
MNPLYIPTIQSFYNNITAENWCLGVQHSRVRTVNINIRTAYTIHFVFTVKVDGC